MNGKVIIKRECERMKIRYTVAEKNSDIGKVTVKKIVGGSAEITVCTTPGKLAEVFTSYESLKKFIDELEDLVDESIKFHRYAWPTDEWKVE